MSAMLDLHGMILFHEQMSLGRSRNIYRVQKEVIDIYVSVAKTGCLSLTGYSNQFLLNKVKTLFTLEGDGI